MSNRCIRSRGAARFAQINVVRRDPVNGGVFFTRLILTEAQMPRDTQIRWTQFGLRGLLVTMAVVAAWLALTCSREKNQAAVVREVQQHGGTVWFDDDKPKFVQFWQSPERTRSTIQRSPKWLRQIFGDELFRDVVQIDFGRSATFPKNAEPFVDRLERLPKLETLRIGNHETAESCLSDLLRVSQLRNLTIEGFPVSRR